MTGALAQILTRPKTVFVFMLMLIWGGILSYINIPKENNPDIDVPVFYVSIVQQGVSAQDAERLLVRPMETLLKDLDHLKEMTALASEGHAGILLEFTMNAPIDQVLSDIYNKINEGRSKLPSEADSPVVFETNFALLPTISVVLSGDVPERKLYQLALELQDALETIPSVRSVELSGHREEVLEVLIDTARLESYALSLPDLLSILAHTNKLIPAGFIDNGQGRLNVKVSGLIQSHEELSSIPLKKNEEGVVTLGDVAELRRTFKDPQHITQLNGKKALFLEVSKRIGTNIIENNTAVREIVATVTKNWPQTVQVDFLFDESDSVFEMLSSLESSILTAISLVVILLIATLGLRPALLVSFAIPTSFIIAFLVLSGLGMGVNIMVMFGLVLTVGLLVDSAIVIVEYSEQECGRGLSQEQASISAVQTMFWPLLSSTATTLLAFLPMLLWPGVAGKFMRYLPIMVLIVLLVSLTTALFFIPVTNILLSRGATLFARLLGRSSSQFPIPMENSPTSFSPTEEAAAGVSRTSSLLRLYACVLASVLRGPFQALGLIFVIVVLCGGILFSIFKAPPGIEFFVEEEPRQAVVTVSARGNLSLLESYALVQKVEEGILQVHGVRNAVTSARPAGASDEFDGGGRLPKDVIGSIQIELEPYCCRRKASELFEEILAYSAQFSGIKVEVHEVEGGPPTGKDVQLEIRSASFAAVNKAVERVREKFETLRGMRAIEDSRALPGIDWQVVIDRVRAGRYQADVASIGAMVQLVTNGLLLDTFRPEESKEEIDIRLRLPEEQRSLTHLENLRLSTPAGAVPLKNFIELVPVPKLSSLERRDGLYSMMIKADLDPQSGVTPLEAIKEIETWLSEQKAELEQAGGGASLFFKFRGANEGQAESMAFLGKAMGAALLMMFLVLLTQFNSFYQTFLTLLTIVLSVFGVLLGMKITGQKFSVIMTGTGIIALAGIVVNNAIILIDTYNRFRSVYADPIEAIFQTALQRIRPILLTTTTTIAGLLPMALQINFDYIGRIISVGEITASWWVQMSTALIFGLSFSTLLTLFVIPTLLALPHLLYRRKQVVCTETIETIDGKEALSL